ncbi:carbohydrate kinase family protein [Parapedobacter tibetensis]|uniref:carbohydrate kinase family protein n=1 Tax=Parapedobacter tibetensis TaxID=2972951 RepID=UPI00214DE030|nr:carbohydrate kinase [Parapedobacter tibetensis]
MINGKNKKVICFGEVLWDILPTGKKPGGAPMNVAYHLNRLGIHSTVISRMGNDKEGEKLISFLDHIGIPIAFVQIDHEHQTSKVIANIGDDNEVNYDIVAPVAWDFIKYEDSFSALLLESDVLVYGSLVARNETSRNTLLKLLDKAKYRLFDINLRAPYYTPDTIDTLLKKADAVKLNIHELAEVSSWLGNRSGNEYTGIGMLQDHYGLQEIIVTKGAQGASFYTPLSRHDYPAVPVQVKDTVGSGDSFLAAFLAQKLRGQTRENMLEFATTLSAYVTTQSGACPPYSQTDLNRFVWEKYLEINHWK